MFSRVYPAHGYGKRDELARELLHREYKAVSQPHEHRRQHQEKERERDDVQVY